LASTPFNLAAGGTDYADAYLGTTTKYWNSTNTAVYGSAKAYIPEIPWNDSCASQLITTALGFTVPYGAKDSCNSTVGEENFLSTGAGSGGPSACAYGTPKKGQVATSGTCRGYAKPSWQRGVYGNPNDGVRDLPDVSLFAANGVWGHYYVLCYSNPAGGGVPCTGAPSGWAGAGGTSFVAPILAGVQALVNQDWGRQGNPNYAYYTLANLEYGLFGNAGCNSTSGTANSCVFHDVTLGDMDVNCRGNVNCYDPSGPNGVLSVSSKNDRPAYRAAAGWDFATGIGTLDVNRLVRSWIWFK
jgi:subtilase family serine protease